MDQDSQVEILGQGPSTWQKRRARKEAAALASSARRDLKRHGFRVSQQVRDEIAAAIKDTTEAVAGEDHDLIVRAMTRLADLSEKHLSYGKKSQFREYADSIGVAVLFALFLRAFVVEAFKIPSGSMISTLEVGDHIFVNKFLYGLRVPFTNIKFFEWRKPRRGEVIVFIYPVDPSKDFIKRVIGVEGDTIEVRNEVVYVNGKAVPHERMPGEYTYWDYDENSRKWNQRTCLRVENDLDGHKFTTLQGLPGNDFSTGHDYPEPGHKFTVPKDHVFVLGDNRDNSSDSRFWGPVPLENIRGRALVVWWSRADDDGPDGIRWNRLGHVVE